MNLADLAVNELKSASHGANLFGNLSIAKKPNVQAADQAALKKESDSKTGGLFSTGTSAKNLFGAPKTKSTPNVETTSTLNSDKDKPAVGEKSKEDKGDKLTTAEKAESKPAGSLFGNIGASNTPGALSSSGPK